MEKRLITDWIPFQISKQQLMEARNNPGIPLIVKGILQRSDAKNHNGRVYPHKILMREAEKYGTEFVSQRRAMGELDHPDSSVVNLKNVSHLITEMTWEGKDLIGSCEILPTPGGNILRELFGAGVKLGISSRGLGSVSEQRDGTILVEDDFELLAFDFVSNPSTHGAFQMPVQDNNLNESVTHRQKPIVNKYHEVESIVRDILMEI